MRNLSAILTYGVDLTYSTYIASSEIIKNDEFLDIVKAIAVVFFCSNPLKQAGSGFPFRVWFCMVAAGLNGIRWTLKRILMVPGKRKFEALKAILIVGYITHVIIDDQLASLL